MNNIIMEVNTRPRKIEVYEDFYRNNNLTPLDKQVYISLTFIAKNDESCFPSHETIAKEVGKSVSTIKRSLNNLEENGYIEIVGRTKINKEKTTNLYIIYNDTPANLMEMKKEREQKRAEKCPSDATNTEGQNTKSNSSEVLNNIIINTDSTKESEECQEPSCISDDKAGTIEQVLAATESSVDEGQAKTLLVASKGNIEDIKKYYEYAKTKGTVNDLGAWLYSAIVNHYPFEKPNIEIKRGLSQRERIIKSFEEMLKRDNLQENERNFYLSKIERFKNLSDC